MARPPLEVADLIRAAGTTFYQSSRKWFTWLHLKILTAEPHWASSPEDYKTAQYVAEKFRAAGLQTDIIPFRVLLNKPKSILIEAFDAQNARLMTGPTRESVSTADGGDPLPSTPQEYASDIAREEPKWSALIRKLGLRVD